MLSVPQRRGGATEVGRGEWEEGKGREGTDWAHKTHGEGKKAAPVEIIIEGALVDGFRLTADSCTHRILGVIA